MASLNSENDFIKAAKWHLLSPNILQTKYLEIAFNQRKDVIKPIKWHLLISKILQTSGHKMKSLNQPNDLFRRAIFTINEKTQL